MATIRYIKDKDEVVVLPVTHEKSVIDSNGVTLEAKLENQIQAKLVSGTNIKTINNNSILGEGNINLQQEITVDATPTASSTNPVQSGGVYTALSTKYEKPAGGIPATDLSSSITDLLGNAVSSISSQEDGAVVFTFINGDTVTVDLNHDHEGYYDKNMATSQPSGGFLPDVVYNLGTLTGTVTFSLAAAVSGNINHYFWTFNTGGIAPTITWPSSNFTWADGTGPTITASKHYEISVLDGVALFLEV